MAGERTQNRPGGSHTGARYFGTIAASVAADATTEITHNKYVAGVPTATTRRYPGINATGATITVVGTKRVFYYWDVDSAAYVIDGYVC